MFSEWNILNVEGQRGQKLLTLWKKPTTPLAQLHFDKQWGKANVRALGNSPGRGEWLEKDERAAPKQEWTGRYVLPVSVCLVFAFCLSCLSSAAEEVPTTTPRQLGPSRTWRQGCFQNRTGFRFTWEWSFLSLPRKTEARSWKRWRIKAWSSIGQ